MQERCHKVANRRIIEAEQAIYTSPASTSIPGYRITAYTDGLSGPDMDRISFKALPSGRIPSSFILKECMRVFHLPSGSVCVTRVFDAGVDAAGRPNRLYAHALVFTHEQYERIGCDPYYVREQKKFKEKDLNGKLERINIEEPPTADSVTFINADDLLKFTKSEERLAQVLSLFLDDNISLREGLVILLDSNGDGRDEADFYRSILHCLPRQLRSILTFTTFSCDPKSELDVCKVVIAPFTCVQPYTLDDLPAGCRTADLSGQGRIPDVTTLPLAELISRYLCKGRVDTVKEKIDEVESYLSNEGVSYSYSRIRNLADILCLVSNGEELKDIERDDEAGLKYLDAAKRAAEIKYHAKAFKLYDLASGCFMKAQNYEKVVECSLDVIRLHKTLNEYDELEKQCLDSWHVLFERNLIQANHLLREFIEIIWDGVDTHRAIKVIEKTIPDMLKVPEESAAKEFGDYLLDFAIQHNNTYLCLNAMKIYQSLKTRQLRVMGEQKCLYFLSEQAARTGDILSFGDYWIQMVFLGASIPELRYRLGGVLQILLQASSNMGKDGRQKLVEIIMKASGGNLLSLLMKASPSAAFELINWILSTLLAAGKESEAHDFISTKVTQAVKGTKDHGLIKEYGEILLDLSDRSEDLARAIWLCEMAKGVFENLHSLDGTQGIEKCLLRTTRRSIMMGMMDDFVSSLTELIHLYATERLDEERLGEVTRLVLVSSDSALANRTVSREQLSDAVLEVFNTLMFGPSDHERELLPPHFRIFAVNFLRSVVNENLVPGMKSMREQVSYISAVRECYWNAVRRFAREFDSKKLITPLSREIIERYIALGDLANIEKEVNDLGTEFSGFGIDLVTQIVNERENYDNYEQTVLLSRLFYYLIDTVLRSQGRGGSSFATHPDRVRSLVYASHRLSLKLHEDTSLARDLHDETMKIVGLADLDRRETMSIIASWVVEFLTKHGDPEEIEVQVKDLVGSLPRTVPEGEEKEDYEFFVEFCKTLNDNKQYEATATLLLEFADKLNWKSGRISNLVSFALDTIDMIEIRYNENAADRVSDYYGRLIDFLTRRRESNKVVQVYEKATRKFGELSVKLSSAYVRVCINTSRHLRDLGEQRRAEKILDQAFDRVMREAESNTRNMPVLDDETEDLLSDLINELKRIESLSAAANALRDFVSIYPRTDRGWQKLRKQLIVPYKSLVDSMDEVDRKHVGLAVVKFLKELAKKLGKWDDTTRRYEQLSEAIESSPAAFVTIIEYRC